MALHLFQIRHIDARHFFAFLHDALDSLPYSACGRKLLECDARMLLAKGQVSI